MAALLSRISATPRPAPPLYDKGMTHWSLDSLSMTCDAGGLPQVCWVLPPKPSPSIRRPSSPMQGAEFTSRVLDALTSNPEVWSKTVFFLTFDENDGQFDHVPPPALPSYNGQTAARRQIHPRAGRRIFLRSGTQASSIRKIRKRHCASLGSGSARTDVCDFALEQGRLGHFARCSITPQWRISRKAFRRHASGDQSMASCVCGDLTSPSIS